MTLFSAVLVAGLAIGADAASQPFAVEVVDDQTGRGVPLVELTTTGGITYVTDSAGLVAFDEPGLMDQRVHFAIKSHGYEFRKDGFGFPGVALDVKPGGSARLKIKRLNIAERLYRVTGQGIYRDSVRAGREPPLKQPLLNAQVIGSDSVVNAIYQGKVHWFWGDTNQVKYPLGLFHVPGATSRLPADGGLDPARGVDLEYYVGDGGFARAVAQMPGEGPTWIGGLAVLPDANGRERMLCGYVKIKQPMEVYRRGIAVWNDDASRFDRVADFDPKVPLFPEGNPLRWPGDEADHTLFAAPFPLVRVRSTAEAYQDPAQYEAFTCLQPGTRIEEHKLDRDDAGRVQYAWKKNTPPVGQADQGKFVQAGLLKPHEGLLQLRDAATGKTVLAHAGSVYWNRFRRRYVLITCELYGTSLLGETWYAEADSPLGPWVYTTKIITHDKYSFYNPKQHPMFDQEAGRLIYFEGTYTHTFSGNEHRTPRYDYNQIMYRLDLADERLALPVAMYDPSGAGRADGFAFRAQKISAGDDFASSIAFFALDRPVKDSIAIYRAGKDEQAKLATGRNAGSAAPLFWAAPPDGEDNGQTVPLYESISAGGERLYGGEGDMPEGFKRSEKPICRVWPSPYRLQNTSPTADK